LLVIITGAILYRVTSSMPLVPTSAHMSLGTEVFPQEEVETQAEHLLAENQPDPTASQLIEAHNRWEAKGESGQDPLLIATNAALNGDGKTNRCFPGTIPENH
jgi:hypothetical protein